MGLGDEGMTVERGRGRDGDGVGDGVSSSSFVCWPPGGATAEQSTDLNSPPLRRASSSISVCASCITRFEPIKDSRRRQRKGEGVG